jgi:di/tricarboxylate transporter
LSDATIVYVIIAGAVALFVSGRFPVEIVAVGVALSLYLTDVLSLQQSLAGFGDPTVLFIAGLFVVSAGLQETGVTVWAGQQLMNRSGGNKDRVLILTMLLVAGMSAIVTPNGAVAALVPVAVLLSIKLKTSPSQMLLPMAFASSGGALLLLTGSPVNVIVNDASKAAGGGGFNFFEYALAGVPLLIGTIVISVLLGSRLVPERRPQSMPPDFSGHARTLMSQYMLEHPIFRLLVQPDSPLVGLTREEVEARKYPGVTLIAAQERGAHGPLEREVLAPNDVLVVKGDAESVRQMAEDNGLRPGRWIGVDVEETELFTRESGVAEVVIPPRSNLIGQAAFPGMVTESGDLLIIAVHRDGEALSGTTILAAGDALLIQGSWEALDVGIGEAVLVVNEPSRIRQQIIPLGRGAWTAITVLVAMVVLLASGALPPSVAALTAACAMVVLRVVTVHQAYRAISWTIVILIGGMIPLSTAMTQSGAAQDIADVLVDAVGGEGPYILLIALFLLVAALGQLISNTATALIVIPVAVAASAELDVSVQATLMVMNVAAAASFFTPIATTSNMMVMEPGGYRFGDYWKLGLPMMAWSFVVAIGFVPLIWSL